MSILSEINETELTLREAKSLLTRLLLDYNPQHPVTVSLTYQGEARSFSLVPKRTRRQPDGSAYAIKEIPYSELEATTATGVYLTEDSFPLDITGSRSNFYGLYINVAGERELRFFNSREKCEKWLEKKLKLLEK